MSFQVAAKRLRRAAAGKKLCRSLGSRRLSVGQLTPLLPGALPGALQVVSEPQHLRLQSAA